MIAEEKATGHTFLLKGKNELALKRLIQAKDSFERSLELDSRNEETREFLEYVSGELGQGSNAYIKSEIEPVAMPELVQEKLDAADEKVVFTGEESAYYIFDLVGIDYQKDGARKISFRKEVKVLDRDAVNRFSSIEYSFNPLYERLYVNELSVFDENGKLVSEGDIANYYILDDTSSGMATFDKTLNMPISGLKSGYRLRWCVTYEDKASSNSFRYYRRFFFNYWKTKVKGLYVVGDVGSLFHENFGASFESKEDAFLFWYVSNPEVYYNEPSQPYLVKYMPYVEINDGSKGWSEIGTKYLEKISDRFDLDLETQSKAEALVEGIDELDGKVEAIARFLQQNLTYKAIEFGQRALVPNESSQILKNLYGDCKDHSLLMHQILKALKIKSHLVLVNSSGIINQKMPSLDQFDHMILYVPEYKEGRFMDLTEKFMDISVPTPAYSAEKHVLVLDSDGGSKLMQIPLYPDSLKNVLIQRKISLTDSNALEVVETLSLKAYHASWMRSYFEGVDVDERKMYVQRLYKEFPDVKLDAVEILNLTELSEPLILNIQYSMADAFEETKGVRFGELPFTWERYYIKAKYIENRRTSFESEFIWNFNSQTIIDLPANMKLISLDNRSSKKNTHFLNWNLEIKRAETKDSSSYALDYSAHFPRGIHQASEYNNYYKSVREALEFFEKPVFFEVDIEPVE